MKHKWEDATSYTQSERRGTIEPRTWEARTSSLRIVVTRKHWDPGRWWLFCPELRLDRSLASEALADAQTEALTFCRGQVDRWREELGAPEKPKRKRAKTGGEGKGESDG